MQLTNRVGFKANLFAVLAMIVATQSVAQVKLESTVSWVTAGQPEINVLLMNQSEDSVDFLLSPLRVAGRILECPTSQWTDWARSYLHTGWEPPPEYVSGTYGRLPAGEWTHRTLLVGGGALAIGCTVTLQVFDPRTGNLKYTAKVRIPSDELQAPSKSGQIERSDLHVDFFVERDFEDNGRLIRILVRNRSTKTGSIGILDKRLDCRPPTVAHWNLRREPPQPLAHGPAHLGANSWVVFTVPAVLNGSQDTAAKDSNACVAHFSISAMVQNRVVPVGKYSVALTSQGFLGMPGI